MIESLPSKGRIVTYHCIKGEEYLGCGDDMTLPAVIVAILTGPMKGVNLIVFTNNPAGFTIRTAVPYGITSGGWTWPVRQPEDVYNKDTQVEGKTGIASNVSKIAVPAPKVG
jgi:hypothetical protein